MAQVIHPGLPGHEIWKRDAQGCNGFLSAVFNVGFDTESLLDNLKLFSIGTSRGGFESLALPISPQDDRKFPGTYEAGPMVRFRTGLEYFEDLIDDLIAAFATVSEH